MIRLALIRMEGEGRGVVRYQVGIRMSYKANSWVDPGFIVIILIWS